MCLIPGRQAAGCGMLVMQAATEDGVCHHRCEQQQIGQPWKHGSSRGTEGNESIRVVPAGYRPQLNGRLRICQEKLVRIRICESVFRKCLSKYPASGDYHWESRVIC